MKLTVRDKFLLYTELAKLVKAGFGIDKATELLAEQSTGASQQHFAAALGRGLTEGKTIAQSVEASGLGVTPLEVSILRATEIGGVIEEGLGYLRDYFETVLHTKRLIQARLIYPALLLHLGALVPVLPPLVTGGPWSEALRTALITLGIVYLLGIALWGALGFLNRSAVHHEAPDHLLRRIPLLGGARRSIALERFANIFRIYLLCGQRVSDGLFAAGEATQSAVVNHAAIMLAKLAEGGDAIGKPMMASGVFPRDFARSVANAETIGGLEEDLGRWANLFAVQVETKVSQIGVWLPKALYLLVVVYVAWQLVQMYAGIYEPVLDLMDGNF